MKKLIFLLFPIVAMGQTFDFECSNGGNLIIGDVSLNININSWWPHEQFFRAPWGYRLNLSLINRDNLFSGSRLEQHSFSVGSQTYTNSESIELMEGFEILGIPNGEDYGISVFTRWNYNQPETRFFSVSNSSIFDNYINTGSQILYNGGGFPFIINNNNVTLNIELNSSVSLISIRKSTAPYELNWRGDLGSCCIEYNMWETTINDVEYYYIYTERGVTLNVRPERFEEKQLFTIGVGENVISNFENNVHYELEWVSETQSFTIIKH